MQSAKKLFEHGLRFTGVVKNATREYPMQHLSSQVMPNKGDHTTMVAECKSQNASFKLMAICWVDRNRRCFISSAGSSVNGPPVVRKRWQEGSEGAELRTITTNIPLAVNDYYGAAGIIDRHNRVRQDDLNLEKSFEVK